jgi:hypothetical protein
VQGGGAHDRIRRALQRQRVDPTGIAEVMIDQAQPGSIIITSASEPEQQRISIDTHHLRLGQAVE